MVEVKTVDLPQAMQRAMSRQAEAEREKRAKLIHAEGELAASVSLLEAARRIALEPTAIQLRYLQTLTEIGVEKNTTVVFPLPLDLVSAFLGGKRAAASEVPQTALPASEPSVLSTREDEAVRELVPAREREPSR
jgi:regulator of protease activity HflC (stomatin/prohibitin superfamily)